MYCPSCGHHLKNGQKFCQNCGRSLVGVTDATEAPEITSPPDVPDVRTQEITPLAPIPEPHWATPAGDNPTTTIAGLAPSIVEAPAGPDLSATTQIPA